MFQLIIDLLAALNAEKLSFLLFNSTKMLIEDLYKSVEKIEKNLEQNMTNKVNIEFLQTQLEKALNDIEKLKDADREIVYKNGN